MNKKFDINDFELEFFVCEYCMNHLYTDKKEIYCINCQKFSRDNLLDFWISKHENNDNIVKLG